jgi:hypothetical protein
MQITATKMTTWQATAKHRIQQMDSLVGSALSDEHMTSWIFNPDRTTEKSWLKTWSRTF